MKLSNGFDARRLRSRQSGGWGARLVAALGALLAACGILLALTGVASLFGHAPALGDLNTSTGGALVLVGVGLVVLYVGVWLWRRSRRRRHPSGLNLSPHLMKKHD